MDRAYISEKLLREGIQLIPEPTALFRLLGGSLGLRLFDGGQDIVHDVGAVGRLGPEKRRAEQADDLLAGQAARSAGLVDLFRGGLFERVEEIPEAGIVAASPRARHQGVHGRFLAFFRAEDDARELDVDPMFFPEVALEPLLKPLVQRLGGDFVFHLVPDVGERELPAAFPRIQLDQMDAGAGAHGLAHLADGELAEGELIDLLQQAAARHPADIPAFGGAGALRITFGQLGEVLAGQNAAAQLGRLFHARLFGGRLFFVVRGLGDGEKDVAQADPLIGDELLLVQAVVALDVLAGAIYALTHLQVDDLALLDLGPDRGAVFTPGNAVAPERLAQLLVVDLIFFLDLADVTVDLFVGDFDARLLHLGGHELVGDELLDDLLVLLDELV